MRYGQGVFAVAIGSRLTVPAPIVLVTMFDLPSLRMPGARAPPDDDDALADTFRCMTMTTSVGRGLPAARSASPAPAALSSGQLFLESSRASAGGREGAVS